MIIAATRFNNQTFFENKRWRESHNWTGCIYGSPIKICKKVLPNARVVVIEMNNSKPEKIMGIGIILNCSRIDIKAKIYSDDYYNRYIYRSIYRKDCKQISQTNVIEYLEEILFRGKTHFKRARGITILPFEKKNGYFILPKKLTRRLIIQDLENKIPCARIIKKYSRIRIQLTRLLSKIAS